MLKKIKFRSLLGNSWVLLIVAIAMAGALTVLLYQYLQDREEKIKSSVTNQPRQQGVAVVVASKNVPAGTPLDADIFVSREIPRDLVYDDMIRVEAFDQYRRAKLAKPLQRGLPLRIGDIDGLKGRDFADTLPPGQRALTLDIDQINSTSAMLRPGNHVDLYWLGRLTKRKNSGGTDDETKVIKLLLPDVVVLATGQDARTRTAGEQAQSTRQTRGDGYSTVTLQIPAEQSARIALAQKLGSFRLILRNPDDQKSVAPDMSDEFTLFSAPERGIEGVQLITGGSTSTIVPTGSGNAPDRKASPPPHEAVSDAASDTATRPQSVYEQANAIARQLQDIDSRSKRDPQ